MLWQTICNLPPRRLGADEDVQPGADHRIIVEQVGRDAHCCEVGSLAWCGRAAHRAKGAKAAGSGFETSDQIIARQQPEFARVHMDEAGERRRGELPTVDAMA